MQKTPPTHSLGIEHRKRPMQDAISSQEVTPHADTWGA